MVNISPSNAGTVGSVPGQELRFYMPHGKKTQSKSKKKKKDAIVTNSTKTLKMDHIKNKS